MRWPCLSLLALGLTALAAPAQTLPAPRTVVAEPPAAGSAPVLTGFPEVHVVPAGADLTEPVGRGRYQGCGMPGGFWAEGDYLFWNVQGNPTPALVTVGPANAARAQAGNLNAPGTRVVAGDERLNGGPQSGFRLRVGMWLDADHMTGLTGSFAYFIPDSDEQAFGPGNGAVLARPFFNTLSGVQDASLVRFPNVADGAVSVASRTSILAGDAYLTFTLLCCENEAQPFDPDRPQGAVVPGYQHLDLLLGYRYFRLSDRVVVDERRRVLDGSLPAGTVLGLHDYFSTRNDLQALDLGLNWRVQRNRLSLLVRPTLGFGWLKGETSIAGFTVQQTPGLATNVTSGGLLAQPTNGGDIRAQRFAWMPQVELTAGYQVTDALLVRAGWSAMYFSNILRAGDAIDRVVNPTQFRGQPLDGEPRPHYRANFTDLWVTGFHAGFEVRY